MPVANWPYTASSRAARGGTLGLLREHFLIAQLHSRRPALHLEVFDSQDAVLGALGDGRVDAAIGNGVVVNQLIDQRYAGRLHVTGVLRDGASELYFGVPRAQPSPRGAGRVRHPGAARALSARLTAASSTPCRCVARAAGPAAASAWAARAGRPRRRPPAAWRSR